jgi:hypothetical protein
VSFPAKPKRLAETLASTAKVVGVSQTEGLAVAVLLRQIAEDSTTPLWAQGRAVQIADELNAPVAGTSTAQTARREALMQVANGFAAANV